MLQHHVRGEPADGAAEAVLFALLSAFVFEPGEDEAEWVALAIVSPTVQGKACMPLRVSPLAHSA